MKKLFYTILPIFLLMTSCGVSDLDSTIFIADKDDRNLPAYTEWGYNSFGAVYERNYFLATNNIVPCKITYDKGLLNFCLTGKNDGREMELTFSFPSQEMSHYKDLIALNKTTIDILDNNCSFTIRTNGYKENVTPVSGYLTFKRAQLLKIDGEDNRVILSGVFELRFLKSGRPETISNGRFDMGINKDFYSFWK
jgi:hypothetical protein